MLSFLIALLLAMALPLGTTVVESSGGAGTIEVSEVPAEAGSTLKDAATAMEVYGVDHQSYRGATVQDLQSSGLQIGDGVTLVVSFSLHNRYCLEAVQGGATYRYDSAVGTVEDGSCSKTLSEPGDLDSNI